jgi:hypothetical protein
MNIQNNSIIIEKKILWMFLERKILIFNFNTRKLDNFTEFKDY